eukprot:g18670.t1
MRAGLQQLADSLHAVLEMAEDCEVKMATETSPSSASPSPREVVQKLKNLVSAGHLNDGFCPFTGKRQRTIGGAEVSDVMEELQVPRKTKRLARIIGKRWPRVERSQAPAAQEPAYKTLNDLLSSEWSGERRERRVGRGENGCIFNVAYRLKSYALTIAVCPSEAPLVCRNFSCRTVWISEAWCGPRRSSFTWYRMAPGKTRELPCSLLRTFEVFPNAELSSPRESREVVYARLSLDPEALEDETEDGEWHIDVTLAEDSDRYWQPPVAPGVAAADVPPLMLCLRSASGVTSVELRDDRRGAR